MARTMRRTPRGQRVRENDRRQEIAECPYCNMTHGSGPCPELAADQLPTVDDLLHDFAQYQGEDDGVSHASEAGVEYRSSGWFGMASEVEHYLAVVGADRDEQGRFLVGGGVALGLGEREIVIAGDAYYLAGGERKNLAAGLRTTSYGMGIAVFM